MSPISELVQNSLDARAAADIVLGDGIKLRNKVRKGLSSLLTQVDSLTWKACQEGGQVGPILDNVHSKAKEIKDNLEYSDLNPTPEQFSWLVSQLNELIDILKERGDSHISDLKDDYYKCQLKIKGGSGYTKMFLEDDWTIIDQSWPSNHPIPELKDRVLVLGETVHVLTLNQRALAQEIDKMGEELTKVDNKVMSSIYSDG